MNGVFEDLTGRRFGRLVVVKELYYGKVLCKCDCGEEVVVKKPYLLNGNTRSCGCLNLDISKKQLAPWTKTGGKFYINRLASDTLQKNNTSGVKGVSYDKARQKWAVEIKIEGVRHRLGRFDTLEEATAVRKAAEEKYFKPVVEEYKAQNIPESMIGKTFGYWTVLAQKKNRLLCRCRCGTEKWVRRRELERGLSKSCGCRRREKRKVDNKNGKD